MTSNDAALCRLDRANEETRDAWNANAAFWDERMGEGNDFVEVLIWPATEQLLQLCSGERVLDIACGNGLTSRRLAAMGAEVVAFDFAAEMIALARERTTQLVDRIQYLVLDATDEVALRALGERQFDAALCNMALFDRPIFSRSCVPWPNCCDPVVDSSSLSCTPASTARTCRSWPSTKMWRGNS